MIKVVEESILDDLPDYSVLVHQCNAKGWMGAGLAAKIAKKWPEVFKVYHSHCGWFKDGHEDEIMGTYVPVRVSPTLIICNAIAQDTVSRTRQVTNYDAWHKICQKIESQTRAINKAQNINWTIHMLERIGCGLGGGDIEKMHEIFKYYFEDSPVQLILHKY